MLKQFKFTIKGIVSVHDITLQTAERAYRNDPDVGCYLDDPVMLEKVVEQQRRLLQAILQHEGVLRRLILRYIYDYIRERLYIELPKPPAVTEEMYVVIGEAINALDFVDRALYLAYSMPSSEYEVEEDADPFEQHTRLIHESFEIKADRIDLMGL